jgi:hypothetical protein
MRNIGLRTTAVMLAVAAACSVPARADTLNCKMKFTMSGWSVFYKKYSGTGIVSCSDGSSLPVRLVSEGGGVTFGKTRIDNGKGDFTGISRIRDVLGDYASGSAHGGAGETGSNSLLTKGDVSLTLDGDGHGFDFGIDAGVFRIREGDSPPQFNAPAAVAPGTELPPSPEQGGPNGPTAQPYNSSPQS